MRLIHLEGLATPEIYQQKIKAMNCWWS